MVERFLKQTTFTSVEDFKKNLQFIIPENFNFAYDVMDAWAEEKPGKLALLWTNDEGAEVRLTFGDMKKSTIHIAKTILKELFNCFTMQN
jgi:acetyl-CoA synthetase